MQHAPRVMNLCVFFFRLSCLLFSHPCVQRINEFADQVVEQRQKALRERVAVEDRAEERKGEDRGEKEGGEAQRQSAGKDRVEDGVTLGHSDILSR